MRRKAFRPGVAQLVARLVRDQEAVGSNPVTRTKNSQALVIQGFAGFLFALLVGLTILDDQGGKNHAEDKNEILYCDSHRNL